MHTQPLVRLRRSRRASLPLAAATGLAIAAALTVASGGARASGRVASAAASQDAPGRAPQTPDRPVVRVMTYNVNFGLAGDPETIAAIRNAGADVVFLQETTPEWEASLRHELATLYPEQHFRHSRGAGGLAVLSRYPVRPGRLLPNPMGWFPAWPVVVTTPLGPVQVLNVHLRPPVSDGGSFVSGYFTTRSVRESEIRAFHAALDPRLPTLVVGDFNEGSSGRAVKHLGRHGFRDALGSKAGPTWRWRTSLGTLRLRLDHILHDARLAVVEARVLQVGRSDHLPVLASFVASQPATATPVSARSGQSAVLASFGASGAGGGAGSRRVQVVQGTGFGCALLANGTVECWGADIASPWLAAGDANPVAMLKVRRHRRPYPVPGVTGAVALVAGAHHACAQTRDGAVLCWGANDYRQLGRAGDPSATAVPVVGLGRTRALVAGEHFTCALGHDGQVRCWGRLGEHGTVTVPKLGFAPTAIPGLIGVVTLAAQRDRVCARSGGEARERCFRVGAPRLEGKPASPYHELTGAAPTSR